MSSFHGEISHQICWDLDRLVVELKAYSDETIIWKTSAKVNNSAGHLSLHLIGNLNHFIGRMIGSKDYTRNRDQEFNGSPISVTSIIEQIDATKAIVNSSLLNIPATTLDDRFPQDVFGFEMTYRYFIMRLAGHLSYHLGQISYHRRLMA